MTKLGEYMDAYHGVIKAVVRCPKPTIARLEGAAVGLAPISRSLAISASRARPPTSKRSSSRSA